MGRLRKAEYIAKYGEEAWEIEAEKRNGYSKQYREANKERFKQYREANKERFAEYYKQWRQDNKEHIKQYSKQYSKQYYEDNKERFKQYYEDNKERIAEQRKQYYEDNKERIAERQKQYYGTQWGRANNIKANCIRCDKNRGYSTDKNVDEDWIIKHVFGSSCIYCGESDWTKLGCDRIDNTKGHTPDNIVCACEKCNEVRNNKFTVEEFIQYRKLHPREEQVPDTDDKVIGAWKGRFKISSNRINF